MNIMYERLTYELFPFYIHKYKTGKESAGCGKFSDRVALENSCYPSPRQIFSFPQL